MTTGSITLKTKKDQPIRRYHPWVFSNAIKNSEGNLVEGGLIEVYSNKGKLLGQGHYQENGSISVRMLTFGEERFDEDTLIARLNAAWQRRVGLGLLNDDSSCFRLIFAEGDQLPGIIADYYNGFVVIQFHSSGMYQNKEIIADTLMNIEEITGVYCKSEKVLSKYLPMVEDGLIGGVIQERLEVDENGHKFLVDFKAGQKTGFFLDQRDNRALLGKYALGKKVLNAFCYTGGFSIYAMAMGAEEVHSLDSSAPALEILEQNIALNDLRSKHKSICEDAMDYIKQMETYDIVILDPPAFAKGRSARHNAVQGYKRLNAAAMRQIKKGGLIFTFSCSQAVDTALFYNTIVAAGLAAERDIRVLHKLSQPADHPVSLYHPEGEYLKGLVIEVN